MSINKEERKIIVGLEVEKARRTFAEIEVLRQAGLWDNIANRLYYAAFHAVNLSIRNFRHCVKKAITIAHITPPRRTPSPGLP